MGVFRIVYNTKGNILCARNDHGRTGEASHFIHLQDHEKNKNKGEGMGDTNIQESECVCLEDGRRRIIGYQRLVGRETAGQSKTCEVVLSFFLRVK